MRAIPPILVAAGLGLLAGCAPKHPYAPADRIETSAASLDLARRVDSALQDRLDRGGDLHPNDTIRLSFPYLPDLSADQRVQMNGMISPPLLAPVQTRGLTVAALQDKLVAAYREKLEEPAVSVSIVSYDRPPAPPEVFVMGEVARPGNFAWRDGTTPLEAIGRAGGPLLTTADLSRVVLVSPEGDHLAGRIVDVQAVLTGRGAALDYLPPFSVIIVPPTKLARTADRSRQIRNVIGYNGLNIGSSVRVVGQP